MSTENGLIAEVHRVADQKAVQFHQRQSLESMIYRMRSYAQDQGSLLAMFPRSKYRYLALVEWFADQDQIAGQVGKVAASVLQNLDEAQEHWDRLFYDPLMVRRGSGRSAEALFSHIRPNHNLDPKHSPSATQEVEYVAAQMLTTVRKNIPNQGSYSSGFRAYRNQHHLEHLPPGHGEQDAMSLEETEALIRDNLARVLLALEVLAEYYDKLAAGKLKPLVPAR